MLQSKLIIKTLKQPPADADSVNAKLLTQGGFIQQQMAGAYSYLPLGLRVLTKIQTIIREEMNALGAAEILMPALTKKESYEKTGRASLDILFRAVGADKSEYMLNQSHEEVVTPLMQQHIFSYRDLPAAVYQIQNKFRNEPRAKSGLLRGREFNMKDLYSFHETGDDLNSYYEKVKDAYFTIYKRLDLGHPKTVLTYASGGSFSKYSHEFQLLCEAGEDTIYLCTACTIAVNKEIIHEQKVCPECGSDRLEERRGIEMGNIFKLRTRFSEAFGFTYTDEGGEVHPVEMGCYGMGPSRIMGALAETHHDAKGIMWPAPVAPFAVHLVALDMDAPGVQTHAETIYSKLQGARVEVLLDDRTGVSTGQKFADADLIGIPWRWVVSKRAGTGVEVKERNATGAEVMAVEDALVQVSGT